MDNFSTRWEYRILQIPLGQEDAERILNSTVPDKWEMVSCVSPRPDVLLYTFRREKVQRGVRKSQADPGIKSPSEQEISAASQLEPIISVRRRTQRICGRRSDEVEVVNPDGTISYRRVKKQKDGNHM